MTNGIFSNDAERDELIIRIDERQQKILDNLKEIRMLFEDMQKDHECRLMSLEKEITSVKVWTGIFSAIFIPVVIYLLQRAMR